MTAIVVRPSRANRISRDLLSLGLYELWYRKTAYAVEGTDVVIARGILSRDETRIPASKINGVHVHLGSGSSRVAIDTGSGRYTPVAPDLSRRDARRFAAAIVAGASGRGPSYSLDAPARRRRRTGLSRRAKLFAVAAGALVILSPDVARRLGGRSSEEAETAPAFAPPSPLPSEPVQNAAR